MRPIDADALLKHRRNFGKVYALDPVDKNIDGQLVDLRHVLNAPTLDYAPKQQWISVEDGYPEDQQHVLIAYKDSDYVSIGYFDEGFAEWDSLYDNEIVRPDYWMPLPEPPKGE